MQVVDKMKEGISSRKAELQQENSELEGRVGALNEQLEAAVMQLRVGCLHHAMCISSIVTQSNSVCAGCQCVCCQC